VDCFASLAMTGRAQWVSSIHQLLGLALANWEPIF
jgi:hypothetical protein